MDRPRQRNSIGKRTSNACKRCRRHKIKCTGSAPCSNCSKRNEICIFNHVEPQVSVSKRYLSNLEGRLKNLERMTTIDPDSSHSEPVQDIETIDRRQDSSLSRLQSADLNHQEPTPPSRNRRTAYHLQNIIPVQSSSEELAITNPLSAGPSSSDFIANVPCAQPLYLGTSSNWSFSRRVLGRALKATNGSRLSSDKIVIDGDVYDFEWNGLRIQDSDCRSSLPSASHAIYLIRSVQFHVGDTYHLFDEQVFMQELHRFHDNQFGESFQSQLWFIHYLLIIAFGKASVQRKPLKTKVSGMEQYVQAMKLLPDVTQLWRDPFMSAEILCCAALYLQCVDYRYAAYLTVGHAMRTALFQGMHTDMPATVFGEAQVERARKIWWTVYILDRELSSLMGLPIQIADDNISAVLPSSQSATQVSALRIHIRLCRVTAQVVSTVYGSDGHLDQRFLTSTRSALTKIADIADELSHSFRLNLEDTSQSLSRAAATLYLMYHHCIILTTRPLMYNLYEKRLDTGSASTTIVASMQRLKVLLQMCADSSRKSLAILTALLEYDLLGSFIPFDLESAYCSGIIVLMASFVDPGLDPDPSTLIEQVHRVLDDLALQGNLIARSRKAELEQLEDMLTTLKSRNITTVSGRGLDTEPEFDTLQASDSMQPGVAVDPAMQINSPEPQALGQPFDEWTWEDALNSEQLMNIADFLDGYSFDELGSLGA